MDRLRGGDRRICGEGVVDVLDWRSRSDADGAVSVDVCDEGQNHGELHGEVGEIWIENLCVVGNVFAAVSERWR